MFVARFDRFESIRLDSVALNRIRASELRGPYGIVIKLINKYNYIYIY